MVPSILGYCGLAQQVYVLEDGTAFNAEELVAFDQLYSEFTLAPDFGFKEKTAAEVKSNSIGTLVVYGAKGADLGKWLEKAESVLPNGIDKGAAEYTVVMDKDRARVFVKQPGNIPHLRLPVLWVDRFGHAVTLHWQKKTEGLSEGVRAIHCVDVLNHLKKGVQMQWAEYPGAGSLEERPCDILNIRFIGINAPGMLVKGYPGQAKEWPSFFSPAPDADNASVNGFADPVFRPTLLKIAKADALQKPSWMSYGFPLPVCPYDGALDASSMAWKWEYDSHHAEIKAFTDGLNVRTELTYGNGACQRIVVRDDGKEISVVKHTLGAKGVGTCLSRVLDTETSMDGGVPVKITQLPDYKGIQTSNIYTKVNGKLIQRANNHYVLSKPKLDPTRLSNVFNYRYGPANGNELPERSGQTWLYTTKGLLSDHYRKGFHATKDAQEGTSYRYDNQGRLVQTFPAGASNLWLTEQLWDADAWAVSRTTTQFEDKNAKSDELSRLRRMSSLGGMSENTCFSTCGVKGIFGNPSFHLSMFVDN